MRSRTLTSAVIALFALASSPAIAGTLALSTLSDSQLRDVSQTFAAALSARTLEPASNPERWALGLGFAEYSTVKMASANASNIGFVPASQLIGVYSPGFWGLAIEATALPRLSLSRVAFESYGGNLKLVVLDLPSIALRAGMTRAGMNFTQGLDSSPTYVDLNTRVVSASLSVSQPFGFVEPYLLLGWLRQTTDLEANGAVSLFDQTTSADTRVQVTTSHLQLGLGALIAVWRGAHATVEYGNVGGANSYAFKFGWRH